MIFKLTITEDHDSYDVVIAEFNVIPDEAFDIIQKYVIEPDKRKGFLNKILTSDDRLDTRQKHVKQMERVEDTMELDSLIESLVRQ
jgi:hypothetical protein